MSIGLMIAGNIIGSAIQGNSARKAASAQVRAAESAAEAQVEAARIGADALRDNTQSGLRAARRGTRQATGYLNRTSNRALGEIDRGVESANATIASNTRDIINQNDRTYSEQSGMLQPFASSGQNALAALGYELGLSDRPDGYAGFRATPGYEFMQQEGQRAVDGSAASRGGLFSGATIKAQQERGIGLIDQTYQQFLSRLTDRANTGQNATNALAGFAGQRGANNNSARSNRMAGVAGNALNRGSARANIHTGTGQSLANAATGFGNTSNNAFANLGINLANNAAQAGNAQAEGAYGVGNARAAGAIGTGNAWNTGIENALGTVQFDQVYNNGGGMARFANAVNAPMLSPQTQQAYTAGQMLRGSLPAGL